jgi:type I restriction enzyme R subunit
MAVVAMAVAPLDWRSERGPLRFMPISPHADEVVAVTRGYGEATSRKISEGFTVYVRDNINAIAALTCVQRPRDLTRSDLKALRMALT